MAVIATEGKIHWNYFIALERDLEVVARYVEFADSNMSTFSLELAHLLMAASSEVDVVAKLLCTRLAPDSQRRNIEDYRIILTDKVPRLSAMRVVVPRYGLELRPWDNWSREDRPDWWRSYNNVKHERNAYFQEATLKNALNSLAALLCLIFHYYQLDVPDEPRRNRAKETTLSLDPESALLKLDEDFYYENIIG